MHLVLLRHEMDDLPLAIFSDHNSAVAFAKRVEHGDGDEERICELLSLDSSTPLNVSIVSFATNRAGMSGHFIPTNYEMIKDFEEVESE